VALIYVARGEQISERMVSDTPVRTENSIRAFCCALAKEADHENADDAERARSHSARDASWRESSCIRGTGREVALRQHLTRVLRLPVKDVHLLQAGGSPSFLVVSTERAHPALPQRIMWAVWAYEPSFSKWVVIVDEDIDIHDYSTCCGRCLGTCSPRKTSM
jgi:hypothetical protein